MPPKGSEDHGPFLQSERVATHRLRRDAGGPSRRRPQTTSSRKPPVPDAALWRGGLLPAPLHQISRCSGPYTRSAERFAAATLATPRNHHRSEIVRAKCSPPANATSTVCTLARAHRPRRASTGGCPRVSRGQARDAPPRQTCRCRSLLSFLTISSQQRTGAA